VTAGQNVTISGTVNNSDGQDLASLPVVVVADGKSMATTTNATGQYSVTLQPTAAVTGSVVTVTADNVQISSSSDLLSVTPAAASSLASSITGLTTVGPDSAQQITYTLLDAYGNPIGGQTVDFALQQVVGTTSESTSESAEAPGTLSANAAVTDAQGQVTVTYTSSATADSDGDLQDHVIASVPGTSVTNSQAQFAY